MPSGLPDPQVAAAQRVVRKRGLVPLLRDIPGGAVEVVSVRRGLLYRDHVDAGGATIPLETVRCSPRWQIGNVVMALALALFVIPLWGPGAFGHWGGARWIIPAVCGFVMSWIAHGIKFSCVRRLRRQRYSADEGWYELRALGLPLEKPPLNHVSMPQLRAVNQLASEGHLQAVVRDTPDGQLEVVTSGGRGLRRHLVDTRGFTTLIDSAPRERRVELRMLKARARKRYGGRRSDWLDVDLRPDD
jgi:hypothetical protein